MAMHYPYIECRVYSMYTWCTMPLTRTIFVAILYHTNYLLYGGQRGLCTKISMEFYGGVVFNQL
jgi:hypothetical protein